MRARTNPVSRRQAVAVHPGAPKSSLWLVSARRSALSKARSSARAEKKLQNT